MFPTFFHSSGEVFRLLFNLPTPYIHRKILKKFKKRLDKQEKKYYIIYRMKEKKKEKSKWQ